MNSQAVDKASEEDNGEVGCVTAVGASVFGRPVWPSAFHDFVHAMDRREWVRERMTWVNFDLVGVSEGGALSVPPGRDVAHREVVVFIRNPGGSAG